MAENNDQIFVFKSDIKTKKDVRFLQRFLDIHPRIKQWSVDISDVDHVLRIVTATLNESNIADIISRCGYSCETLKD